MKNLLKILLLLITIVPGVYFVLFMISFGNRDLIFDNFDLFFRIHLIVMGITVLLMITYIVLLFKNQIISESRRTQWLLILFFGGFIAMPVYWFIHLRPGISRTDNPA